MTRHILLAEDDHEMRCFLAGVLRKEGYRVVEVGTGAQLLETLRETFGPPPRCAPFDLVISDHRMPGLTGMEVLERLRGEPRRPPFVLLTAFGSAEFDLDSRSAGATLVLNKPFDVDELRSLVRCLVDPRPS